MPSSVLDHRDVFDFHIVNFPNLVPRAFVAFPQNPSRSADTTGERRPDLDKFCLAQTDVLGSLKLARSPCAGSVEELTVRVYCWRKIRVLAMAGRCSENLQ